MKKKVLAIVLILVALIAGLFMFRSSLIDIAIKRQAEAIGYRFQHGLLSDAKLHVIMVGTGTPNVNPRRVQSSVAVIADGVFILFDAGAGAADQADKLGLPLSELKAVFLTHLHSDHMADLPLVASKGWRYGRTTLLDIYGPGGTIDMMAGFNQAHRLDRQYRYENVKEYFAPLDIAVPIAHNIGTPGPTEKKLVHQFSNGLKVYAFAVEHAPVEPAFGYRIEYKGRTVVISGDTKACENMARQAEGADILIHEAWNKNLVNKMLDLTASDADATSNRSTRMLRHLGEQVQNYHTSPVSAAKIASRAKVKKLVFTHIAPPMGPWLPRRLVTQPFFLQGVSDVYKGEVVIGEDGMHFELEFN